MIGYVLAGVLLLALLWLAAVLLRRAARGPSEYQKLRDAGRRARGDSPPEAPMTVPKPLAFAFFRLMCWALLARCWLIGGDVAGLRRALNEKLEIARRYGVRR